jgi:predicted amidohydrolase YtcJ
MTVGEVPVPDLVLRNARVVTFASGQPDAQSVAQSVAVKDGRVLAVGTDDELAPLAAAAGRTADLGGRVVLPGLNDSHIHAMRGGLDWERTLHWQDVRSVAAALTLIREAAGRLPAGEWIRVVGGWHSRQLAERRLPTRAELDAAAPDHPVYLQELYDRGVLNSAALARCGWDDAAADPPGGRLLRDSRGSLTGEITGIGAFNVPNALDGTADQDEEIRGTAAMMAEFAGHGLTGVIDGGGMATTPRDYDALYELWRRGGLTMRTRLFICTWTPGREVDDYAQLTTVGQPDFGDPMLKVSGVGEMPHSGCHDFEGLDDEFAISDSSYDELLQITRLAARRGWRLSVHAVLDRSLSRVLDAWEQVERETGAISRLHCSIVHADGASRANLRRIAALRAGILVQNRLLLKGTDYVRAWGQEATDAAPPLGAMRELGIPVGGGTDATRANWYSPWACIWWLVNGRSIDGTTRRRPQDRLSRHDAIASYTRDAAWFTGEEGWRGQLRPGYAADICVPTANPFECAEEDLPSVRSDLTITAGRVTYARGGFEDLLGYRTSPPASLNWHAADAGMV